MPIVCQWNLFDGNPSLPQSEYLRPDYVTAGLKELQPYFDVTATLTTRPLDGEERTVFETFASALVAYPDDPPAPAPLRTSLAAFRQLNFRSAVLSARDAYERAIDALSPSTAARLAAPVSKGRGKPHPGVVDTFGPMPGPPPTGATTARGLAPTKRPLPLPPNAKRDAYVAHTGG